MGPDSDLILAYLGSNTTGVKLLPGHWNGFNLLKSVPWTNTSSVLLLCMYVCKSKYVYGCVYVCIWLYLYKRQNVHREDDETENPASPAVRAMVCQARFLLIVPQLSLFESHLWALQCKPVSYGRKPNAQYIVFSPETESKRGEVSCWNQEWRHLSVLSQSFSQGHTNQQNCSRVNVLV